MFNILKYNHDAISGSLEIRVAFQLKDTANIIPDGGHFAKKSDGDAWLHRLKKDYFTIRVENWIIHKEHIIENSPGHKTLAAKKEAVKYLRRYILWACETASFSEACGWFLDSLHKFEMIIPGEKNPSHESSIADLKMLCEFAKTQLGSTYKKAS